jgi:hypothetical protein
MKLKTFIFLLQKIEKDHPNLEVIYSSDDEGNHFEKVKFEPSMGVFGHGEFVSIEQEESNSKANAVCIN